MDLSRSINVSLAIDGINQQQLADKMGVAPSAISAMVQRGTCHTYTITKLAQVFGIRSSEFVARGEVKQ